MGAVKRFTFEERLRIESLLKEGFSYAKMGKILNRSHFSLRNEVDRFGGAYEYTAKKAQEGIRVNAIRRAEAYQCRAKRRAKEHEKLLDRVNNLEQQIDILFDIIKGLQQNDNKED